MNAMTEQLQSGAGPSIGAILIDSGRLTIDAAERILRLQQKEGMRFGDAALQLGLLGEDDIQQVLSRQYDYTYLAADDDSMSSEVVAAFKPFSPVVEQLRLLRSQLLLRWFDVDSGGRALAVLSPDAGEGRSFVAANLAVVFAQLGQRTLLVDADLRRPCQHRLFRIPDKHGLSSILAGRAELAECIGSVTRLKNLSLLPAGAVPPNPQELLSRPQFAAMLSALCGSYDVVIVDTPPAARTADHQPIASRARGAIVVARKHLSSAQRLQALVRSLQESGTVVVGSVLNQG
ncbi:MAG: chain length determinant protein tyrosine kinase EpsG [Accumulibacter sp.]|jgi:protein-tyrosine kinase|uniref:chain length determinant protein tyrosine kinase EpsG n=1 Tax=Accumulibacter sp. TaxID=2053492 RepID=UPI002FC2E664